jgi:hypothetical protein
MVSKALHYAHSFFDAHHHPPVEPSFASPLVYRIGIGRTSLIAFAVGRNWQARSESCAVT